MDARACTGRAVFCERAHLRYSPEPNLGKVATSENQGDTDVRVQDSSRIAAATGNWQIYVRRHSLFPRAAAILALAMVLGAPKGGAQSQDRGDWIETWTASPQPIWSAEFFAPIGIPRSLRNQTVRQIATISLGGKRVRVEFSNEYGSLPLVIGAAHVAVAGQGGAIAANSDRTLTFGGKTSVTIPPGAPVVSDPVDLTLEPLSSVAVSLFLPEQTPLTTFHWEGVRTAYTSPEGNFAGDTDIKTDSTIKSRLFLSGRSDLDLAK
jgi:hypothetical protein